MPVLNQKSSFIVVYLSALLTGLTMVSFAASSTLLKENGLTDGQYGFIFIPQLITAIIGSVIGGVIAKKVGLKALLIITLVGILLSQISLLMAVINFPKDALFFGLILSTSLFGLGFGFSAAPLNTYPGIMFPGKKETALVALHTILGSGLAIGPLLVGLFIGMDLWSMYPILLIGIAVVLALLAFYSAFPEAEQSVIKQPEVSSKSIVRHPVMLLFVAVAIMYSFAEGTFANWAVVFLNEQKNIPLSSASGALSIFWASLAGGRLIVSILLLRIPSKYIWIALPVFIVIAFLLTPFIDSTITGVLLFGFAGLSCSAFFPITMDLSTKYFKSNAALASSIMTAALMFGVGIGSYLIGAFRSLVNLDTLFRFSAFYPAMVLVLAIIMNFKFFKPKTN